MNRRVRVRFAPSPTGGLHIGGIRTALYNYLFAKQNQGDFILRIEDTDQSRYVEGAENYIIDALNWCGLHYDEGPDKEGAFGPYRQSERKNIYAHYSNELINKGKAYYAFDTAENLDFHRKDHESRGKNFIYNWHNRLKLENSLSLSSEETQEKLENGTPYVIRFKSPSNQKLILQDIIRGTIEIDSNVLDDKVLFKSDGMPTYHLANVVDDHEMQITHVIRGEEWLPSMPLHQLLYEAFEWEVPQFAHLPLIMKPTGKGKLSKRDGEKMGFPVFPLTWKNSKGYREEGYFPESVINFLALLGWNPGTEQELFNLSELITAFSLERVHKSGARFDPEKNKWYNQQYIQQKSHTELVTLYQPILEEEFKKQGITWRQRYANENEFREKVEKIISLTKERATFVHEFWNLTHYFFIKPSVYDSADVKKQWKNDTADIMNQLVSQLEINKTFTATVLENSIKTWATEKGVSFGKFMPPLRLAIVGSMQGPHIYDILETLGQKESIDRIKKAVETLG